MNNTTENSNSTAFTTLSVEMSEIIWIYNLYLIVAMVLGFLGNILVLAVYIKNGAIRTTDWFIIFISVYDFISSSLNVPVYLTFTTGLWRHYGNDVICKIHMVFSQSTVLSSAFLTGGLALERYIKVCRPSLRLSKAVSRNTCIILSLVTFASSLPALWLYDNRSGICRNVIETLSSQVLQAYYFAVILVFMILFFIIIFSYSNIVLVILRSKANVERHSRPKKDTDNERKCFKMICCGKPISINNNKETNKCVVDDQTIRQNTSSTQVHVAYVLPESSASGLNDGQTKRTEANDRSVPTPARVGRADKLTRVQRSLRTTRLTFVVCVVFVLSWLPPWGWFATGSFVTPTSIGYQTFMALNLFCPMTFLINTFANPLLYISLNASFREKVRNLVKLKLSF